MRCRELSLNWRVSSEDAQRWPIDQLPFIRTVACTVCRIDAWTVGVSTIEHRSTAARRSSSAAKGT